MVTLSCMQARARVRYIYIYIDIDIDTDIHTHTACMCAKSLQSCLTLCDSMDCSPPGSSVHGILQARILNGWSCPPPGDLPNPGMEAAPLMSPALAGRFLTTSTMQYLYTVEMSIIKLGAFSLL